MLGNYKSGNGFWMLPAIVLLITVCFGCAQPPAAAMEKPTDESEEQQRRPVFAVVGADRSGSYEDLTKVALSICCRILHQGQSGDKFLFRYISHKSYAHDEVFGRVELPSLPLAPSNPFDIRAKRQYQLAQSQVARIKAKWLKHFESLRPSSAPRTDIIGFVCAAADVFALIPVEYNKRLYLATDLKDNVGYRAKPKLDEVEVVVFALKPDHNPARMQRRKDRWKDYFLTCGALSVQFLAAEVMQ